MSDGLVQFLHRRSSANQGREDTALLEKSRFKYLRYTDFSARPGDVVIKQVSNENCAKQTGIRISYYALYDRKRGTKKLDTTPS
jgi:hypothetical protein